MTALAGAGPAGADTSPYEEKAFLPVNVKDFGAVGNGTTDDTTAVNNAIASVPAGGGTVFFPRGGYSLSGQINVDTKRSIRLVGESGVSSGLGTGTSLIYTGTASPFISAQSLTGFELRDLSVFYASSGFSGTLVDLSGSVFCTIERCMLVGAGVRTAAQLVLLNRAQCSQIVNCMLANAAVGIRGSLGGGSDFSNAMTVTGCSFPEGGMTTAAIAAAGQGWMISGCTFEPLYSSSAPGAYKQIAGSAIGICFAGCWFGDNTASGTWVDFSGAGGVAGASFVGNYFGGLGSGSGTGIRLGDSASGVSITGNQFAGLTNGVQIDNNARQVVIAGNSYSVSGTRIVNTPLNGIVEDPGLGANGALGLFGPIAYGGNMLLAPTALSHPSRVLGTVYQPSTTRSVMVIATVRILNSAGQSGQITALVENANPPTLEQAHFSSNDPSDMQTTITFIVPAGWRYKLSGSGTGTMVLNVLTEVTL